MSDYTAIADVGETLIDLLRENMGDLITNPAGSIVLISPGEIDGDDSVRLSLFLYQVVENAHLKNQEMQKIGSATLEYPPLPLDLFYMLTSHPAAGISDKTERTKEEHSVLGRAMQVLNDNAILAGSALRGGLIENIDELHITSNPLNLDDLTKIWSTFQDTPFRPSVCYRVQVIMIDSKRRKDVQRIVEKDAHYYQIK